MCLLYLCPLASTAKVEKTVIMLKFDIASNERESRNLSRLSRSGDSLTSRSCFSARETKPKYMFIYLLIDETRCCSRINQALNAVVEYSRKPLSNCAAFIAFQLTVGIIEHLPHRQGKSWKKYSTLAGPKVSLIGVRTRIILAKSS
jgi:hypothetical protein